MDTSAVVSSLLLAVVYLHCTGDHHLAHGAMDSCYDDQGGASRCMPRFENAAFNRTVVASNVCGSPPEDYCMQTGSERLCRHCDLTASEPGLSHNASLLTDFHADEEPTWWQSQSMFYGVQHPNSVNLTLHLGKAFEITYVRLKFYTSRPESFAIYRRTEPGGPWLPYQYYSASCRKTYGKDAKGYIQPGTDERAALCTDEFSDISPLTGGNVAFSTLEGRPSAYNFDESAVLQEWVTATDLLVSLDRLNTFGDEFFKDAKVLRSYFYAISDFSVGGRCKCNGHASECVEGDDGRLVCVCQHHTAGVDCQKCQPFYQDRPWARANGDSANQCLKCNCSGRSEECVLDMEQYRSTGSGGRCVNCRDNTDGAHCERCREDHYRPSPQDPCLACLCNSNGSLSSQCDEGGRCACRPGVTGDKCDTCQAGFHSLGLGGCRPCECHPWGSVRDCSPMDGGCYCRQNVEGQACDRCKPGFFNLQQDNPEGCQSCFCSGHSLACSSSNQHAATNITSDFIEDQDGWSGVFSGGMEYPLLWKEGEVYLLPLTEEDIGFYKAPDKFLGNQIHSYGQLLSITFTAETTELLPGGVSVFLEGSGGGTVLSASLSPEPSPDRWTGTVPHHVFSVRLHEGDRRLRPSLSTFDLQHLLYNLTALTISNAGGHNYTSQLSGVTLGSASSSSGFAGPPAPWVEACACPASFQGQHCERCAPGFTREEPSRGQLSPCVPCNCHQHGPCHPETGVCECSHFTTGTTCDRCVDGYYGNALIGTPADCLACPCPHLSSCALIAETGDVVCTNCPPGQRGSRCQMCEDGFYGDPLGQSGPPRPCARCDCHGNVDPNAVGVCDHTTGRCLKCLGHTEGDHCERCRPGFYGDARNQTASQKCKACSCSPAGTSGPPDQCHPMDGRCHCLGHVTGRDCSHCDEGFFNLQPGRGCERCECNPVGSLSTACHPVSGQCMCRAGVEGRLCDSCRVSFFGFSTRGCRACNCDPMGSIHMQCHSNGTCHCRQGFVGYKCDKCEMNYYHNRATHQCEECPLCYGLVKEQAERLRTRLQDLEKLLARFDCRGRLGQQHRPMMMREHHHVHGARHEEPHVHGARHEEPHVHGARHEEPRVHGARHEDQQQGEDTLPNALEDFLAMQEAREAFIKQFSLLAASTHTLLGQLQGVTSALNCSVSAVTEDDSAVTAGDSAATGDDSTVARKKSDDGSVCHALSRHVVMVGTSQKQLKQATLDLDNMIIPFEMLSGPNKWNIAVNDSRALMTSHREMAEHMEDVAGQALRASNQTFSLLMDLLLDNSTQGDVMNLSVQLLTMQQMKENLTAQVNETLASQLALEESSAGLHVVLANITSSLHQLSASAPSPSPDSNQTTPGSNHSTAEQHHHGEDLLRRTSELALHVQAKEELVSKIREEMDPLIQTASKNLEMDNDIHKLKARAQGAKVLALSSVVAAKAVESETIRLHRELTDMQREWPRREAQTKAALKKERPLEEKVLTDVRKKVKQMEKMLKPVLESTGVSSNTSKEAERTAHAVAKESKATLTQAKLTRTASGQLRSQVEHTLQQLAEQEKQTARAHAHTTSEPEVSLTSVKEDMEAAKLRLEAYSNTLTELINKIDEKVPLERFDRVLNETARRLTMLRGSVESPGLGWKIQKLRLAAKEQQNRLGVLEQDLQEIREERDSLRDITLNLPQSCPQATGAGKG